MNKELINITEEDIASIWGNKLSTQQRKEVYNITHAFGLNPFLQHLTILGGNIYITHSGLSHYATKTGRVLPKRNINIIKENDKEVVVEATIYISPEGKKSSEYIKEMKSIGLSLDEILSTMEIKAFGRANLRNVTSMVAKYLPEMAEKRAYNRAYRQAFEIGICSVEEIAENPTPPNDDNIKNIKNITPEKNINPEKKITVTERVVKLCKTLNITVEELDKYFYHRKHFYNSSSIEHEDLDKLGASYKTGKLKEDIDIVLNELKEDEKKTTKEPSKKEFKKVVNIEDVREAEQKEDVYSYEVECMHDSENVEILYIIKNNNKPMESRMAHGYKDGDKGIVSANYVYTDETQIVNDESDKLRIKSDKHLDNAMTRASSKMGIPLKLDKEIDEW